ncbi:ABC transporter ATP-binding protein YbbL [Escherichia coli]|uniref:ABC transporter ATP-binding protein YbbL n=1 Tax=Escherichia coli TaxID=562 RepID=A0A376RN73_ECOLX|nr:ABC transporter ATP-binding protein YbbL [Escherichia coli]
MQENSPLLQLQNVGYLAGDTKILNNINFRCVLANLS